MTAVALTDVAQIAQALVRIPSVNPMGRGLSGPEFLEGRVTDFLESQFRRLGIASERHEVLPERENILARVRRGGDQGVIMLEVHQDTVPVDRMTIDPFGGEIRGGRLWGRGACDIKGGMAAMLHTVSRLSSEPSRESPDIVFACTVNEENGFDGVQHLCSLWERGESRLLPSPPDVAIVAEPTRLQVVTAHKGAVRWRCHTLGRAAHSSAPEKGTNAVYAMARLLRQLERYAKEVVSQLGHHELVGHPTLSVGTIEGGISVNTVPDRCTIQIDRRLLPGESGTAARQHVIDFVGSELPDVEVEHELPYTNAPGLSDQLSGALAKSLAGTIRQHGIDGKIEGVQFGTDASTLAAAGVPTVVFGPGDVAQAHTKDEWVDLSQLETAADILYSFCQDTDPRSLIERV